MSDTAIRITVLENGFTVATEAMPGIATASLGVWIGAGARHERPEEHGLSHLLEHMAFKGTQTRSARRIAEDIEGVGGDINAATSVEYTCYTARVLGQDIGIALDVLGDILTNSSFAPAELERERGVILQEIAAVEDTPDDLVNDLFLEAAFPDQALGRPILGTPETVAGFTSDTIRAFIAREYRPGRMVLAAAGAVVHEEAVAAARRLFGALPPGPADDPPAALYRGGERRVKRRLEQANVVLGFPGRSFRDPGHHAAQLFAHALGGSPSSRLWQAVRETRGLAYDVDAFHWPFSDCGVFGIGGGVGPKDIKAFAEVSLATAQAASLTLEAAEMARAKAGLKVSMLAALETPGGRTERMARQLLAWGRILPGAEIVARVDAVTLDEVRGAGQAILAGPATLAAIGPIAALPRIESLVPAAAGLRQAS